MTVFRCDSETFIKESSNTVHVLWFHHTELGVVECKLPQL